MRVSYAWLRELLPELAASPEEVADRLRGAGLAVDAMQSFGVGQQPVVLAQVRRVEPHPARAALQLVTVDRGGGHEQRVVCGASNVPPAGQLVALAPLGAVLPKLGSALTPREIGGVLSEGMLCSESELGLAETSNGILVLPEGAAAPGTLLSAALPAAADTIFELDITPNRPDALGHVGIARDLAVLFGGRFNVVDPGAPQRVARDTIEQLVRVENRDPERCPRYGAAAALDVQVRESPAWMRWRLHSLGIRPISNVVDITNWLLLEYGHPMHAFDLDRVSGGRIIIRRASDGEAFTTLDGVARSLSGDDLVIADGERPSALAGIMGGQDSEISDSTRRVLLECAYFAPRGIRRSARRHGMHTESSHRFERGVDIAAVPRVLARAQALLSELADATAVAGLIDASGEKPTLPLIPLRAARIDALLGTPVPFADALDVLDRLGFSCEQAEHDRGQIRGASHRPDVEREVDLIEEIARVRGYDAIPTRLPAIAPQPPRISGELERRIVGECIALGLNEALTYAFVAPHQLTALSAPPPTVFLTNPLTEERSVMRTSLLPELLQAVGRARRHGENDVRLFAVGARFLPPSGEEPSARAKAARPRSEGERRVLPEERPSFAAVVAGSRSSGLGGPRAAVDVYDAKGLAVELCERLTGRPAEVRHAGGRYAHLHPRATGEVLVGELVAGSFGTLHPDVVDAFDLGTTAHVVELDVTVLERLGYETPRHRPIPRLPPITRDVAFELDERVLAGDVVAAIRRAATDLCESVELFDVFQGGNIPSGRRSLAFRIVYRDPKARIDPEHARTLTDKEVDEQQSRVVKLVSDELGGVIRA